MEVFRRCWQLLFACSLFACSPRNSGFDAATNPTEDASAESSVSDISSDLSTTDTAPSDGPSRDGPAVDVPPATVLQEYFRPGAPMDARMRFAGSEAPALAPTLVYPEDGTIIPGNLDGFEVHFRRGMGGDLFQVSFRGDVGVVHVYASCEAAGDGCAVPIPTDQLREISRAAGPGERVQITVRASDGTNVGTSTSRSIGIVQEEFRGGVYYWAANPGSIMRYEFGRPNARAETYIPGNIIACVGCHVLSRDGQRAAVGRSIPAPAPTRVLEVGTRRELGMDFGANFGAFSPDNAYLLTSDGLRLTLRDGATGNPTTGLPNGMVGTMPDWSPDGSRVVAAIPSAAIPIPGQPGHSGRADLVTLPWNGRAFGSINVLVQSEGENNYYPSFSPDGRWVLFNRSGNNSYDAVDAHLWAVPTMGGAPVQLSKADQPGELSNSWPRWAPFQQTHRGEGLLWFTFSSRRDYGLRIRQQGRAREMQVAQLWMAAFRPNASGVEPSAPAFWLPFQDRSAGNHIAQWTQQIRRQTCMNDNECSMGERCVTVAAAGQCVAQ